ncbi:peptidoglycan D,D-transpeptidase FtsI family protein [Brockia lithotrophica]|uniref:Cell elongation-specific peptidoglycan D,D-transpeptidase n=1 Tax=Brockia lithotrophica TaxID=933949 RepID=A0A660L8A4_9BACL|nr:penicillin-binding transpeptidase domain-containing protein [Brockia lithotrophica]RKQ89099.1 cell elongation-specific peptidoglycan D,D-transpeptidase [Brockia lithotrophica]
MEEPKRFARRINVLFLGVFVLFSLLLLRLTQLQLVHGEDYARLAETLVVQNLEIPAARGWIYDRNGAVLAKNRAVYTLTFVDLGLTREQLLALAARLEALLRPEDPKLHRVEILRRMDVGLSYRAVDPGREEELRRALDEGAPFSEADWKVVSVPEGLPPYTPRVIADDVSERVTFAVEENAPDYPGVKVAPGAKREYPNGSLAAHVLGYTGWIPAEEATHYFQKGYAPTERVGRNGVEKTYDDVLRGQKGLVQVQINRKYEGVVQEERRPPRSGYNLVLSLDARLQKALEDFLRARVDELSKDPSYPAKARERMKDASAVVLDVRTGEILALANYRTYDPNYLENLENELNRAVSGTYLPGSTFKMVTVLTALHEKLFAPNERFFASGTYYVGTQPFHDWSGAPRTYVDGQDALKYSINGYMIEVGKRLMRRGDLDAQIALVRRYAASLGLGVRLGVDLPGETDVTLKDIPPEQRAGSLAQMMFGQGDQYTPLQLAVYVAAIANGGDVLWPHVAREIRVSDGTPESPGAVVETIPPRVLWHVPFTQEELEYVRRGMWKVASEPGGTAYWTFAGLGVSVAAKTGTAEIYKIGNTSIMDGLMVGFAPYENPEIAFAVVFPGGKSGSADAGGIARKIVETYFELRRADSLEASPAR